MSGELGPDLDKWDSPTLPVYLLLDVSASMRPVLPDVVEALFDWVYNVVESSTLRSIRLSILTYADSAQVDLPLTPVEDMTGRLVLTSRGGTFYAPVFKLAAKTIKQDIALLHQDAIRVLRPIVLFVTDGSPMDPEDQWDHELNGLRELRVNVMAIGITGDEDPRMLQKIASHRSLAFIVSRSSSSFGKALFDLLKLTTSSISASASASDLKTGTLIPPDSLEQIPDLDI